MAHISAKTQERILEKIPDVVRDELARIEEIRTRRTKVFRLQKVREAEAILLAAKAIKKHGPHKAFFTSIRLNIGWVKRAILESEQIEALKKALEEIKNDDRVLEELANALSSQHQGFVKNHASLLRRFKRFKQFKELLKQDKDLRKSVSRNKVLTDCLNEILRNIKHAHFLQKEAVVSLLKGLPTIEGFAGLKFMGIQSGNVIYRTTRSALDTRQVKIPENELKGRLLEPAKELYSACVMEEEELRALDTQARIKEKIDIHIQKASSRGYRKTLWVTAPWKGK